jgi:hypothetical protein
VGGSIAGRLLVLLDNLDLAIAALDVTAASKSCEVLISA